jgi:hypothetical protein
MRFHCQDVWTEIEIITGNHALFEFVGGTVLKYHTVGTVLKYHTVVTVQKSNRKIKNATLSEQFQSPINRKTLFFNSKLFDRHQVARLTPH